MLVCIFTRQQYKLYLACWPRDGVYIYGREILNAQKLQGTLVSEHLVHCQIQPLKWLQGDDNRYWQEVRPGTRTEPESTSNVRTSGFALNSEFRLLKEATPTSMPITRAKT